MADLEEDVEILSDLDDLRIRSAALRDEGRQALWNDWKEKPARSGVPDGIIEDALVVKALAYRNPARVEDEDAKRLEALIRDLESLTVDDVMASEPGTMPVLRAARAMQALVAAPDSAFSESTMYFYYRVVREIYMADAPDWNLGGARAGQGGSTTAFMTGECVRAIAGFARTLERTARFIGEIRKVRERGTWQEPSPIPADWRSAETERLRIHFYITIKELASNIALSLEPALSKLSLDWMDAFLNDKEDILSVAVKNASESFRRAYGQLVQKRENEEKGTRFNRSESGHAVALLAVEKAWREAEAALEELLKTDQAKALEKLEERFQNVSYEVLKLLHPARGFLSAVLDRELAAASAEGNRGWDPAEMAFAAASYGAITGAWDDERLARAGAFLSRMISERGRMPVGQPIFSADRGYKLHVTGGEILRAFAQLLQHVPGVPVTPALVRSMLRYFDDTRIPGSAPERGWCHEEPVQPVQSCRWATAITVLALDRINRMLDHRINLLVFRHFSVKQSRNLDPNLRLATLFYGDYGLRKAPKAVGKTPLRRDESVALLLQRMRAHVLSLGRLKPEWDPLYSIVLHGPAGTGKTSLIEALALTCDVPLVEVTPSDLVIGGADFIERRTRAVFKALSLLTRVVIVFDEFDPVLKRRDPKAKGPSTIFSFLTPGMLPKLKTLNLTAKRRHVAYALITNMIGTLDEAAVRSGRFDAKAGIYPPDLLSRTGRLWSELLDLRPAYRREVPGEILDRIPKVVEKTAGAPMQTLGKPGWFTQAKDPKPGTPFHFILNGSPEPAWPMSEDTLALKGTGTAAKQEFLQWSWINSWDDMVSEKIPLAKALAAPPRDIGTPQAEGEGGRGSRVDPELPSLFGLVMLVAALFWFGGRRLRKDEAEEASRPSPPAPLPSARPDPRERGA